MKALRDAMVAPPRAAPAPPVPKAAPINPDDVPIADTPARAGIVLEEPPAGAPGLKLMFIVWNRNRRQRMASVKIESEGHTSVVREGDIVGGVSVASIHPEAVDFRWMQRTYRVYTGRF